MSKIKSVKTIGQVLAPGSGKPRDFFERPGFEVDLNDTSGVITVKDSSSGKRVLIGAGGWMSAVPLDEQPAQSQPQQAGKR